MNVLLDLDGTLTNPREGILGCIKHALSALDETAPADGDLVRFIGPPLRDAFEEILATDDSERVDAAIAAYRARYSAIGLFENEVYDGIPEALSSLSAGGARLFLATSKPSVFAARILAHYGLAEHFEGIYGSALDGSLSDKGELIAHILSAARLRAAETVMVGDRRYDVLGAIRNRVLPVGVLWGYGSREELTAAGAARFFEKASELGRITI